MRENEEINPEMKLFYSIIEDEIKDEEDKKLKEIIKKKAEILYLLLSLTGRPDLDEDEIRKQIKSLIEEDS